MDVSVQRPTSAKNDSLRVVAQGCEVTTQSAVKIKKKKCNEKKKKLKKK